MPTALNNSLLTSPKIPEYIILAPVHIMATIKSITYVLSPKVLVQTPLKLPSLVRRQDSPIKLNV